MRELQIEIAIKSPVLVGSGDGYGSLIDQDIVSDSRGFPYIPGRTLKGLLRESAVEVGEMFLKSGIRPFSKEMVDQIFGQRGTREACVSFDSLKIPDYENTVQWLTWAMKKFPGIVSVPGIIDSLTVTRQMTALDESGIVLEQSLRTVRVLKRGLTFNGPILLSSECEENHEEWLALACSNLRRIGLMRNRGMGEVVCILRDGQRNLTDDSLQRLERI